MNESVDVLAFGAHPDDVEIGMGGTIAKLSNKGYRIAICDLTEAELSSNGTVEIRKKEAAMASEIIGVVSRYNLQLADRGLSKDEMTIEKVVKIIRQLNPEVVFAPYYKDRHPDHGHCSEIVEEAVFTAGIKNFMRNSEPKHRVENMYYYIINGFQQPNFTVDISSVMEQKMDSLKAYKSQFILSPGGVQTPLTDDYLETVIARDRLIGKEVGVKYAEGFMTKKPLLLFDDLLGREKYE
jgi:bacillithiol biosynthesis deacetylase BshB1